MGRGRREEGEEIKEEEKKMRGKREKKNRTGKEQRRKPKSSWKEEGDRTPHSFVEHSTKGD